MEARAGTPEVARLAKLGAATLLDFRRFCACLTITPMGAEGGAVRFDRWHPEQEDFERNRCGRDIVLKSRKIGMTTLELARDVQFAVTRTGVNVLIIGHDSELVDQAFLAVHDMVEALVAQHLIHPPERGESKREIVWKREHGGSAIRITEAGATTRVARKKGRSSTTHRLHCTEVAFWGEPDATMKSALNSLARNAEVVIESTADGIGNRFHSDVKRARAGEMVGYRYHFWPWFFHPGYTLEPPAGFSPAPENEWEEHLQASVPPIEFAGRLAFMRSKVSDGGGGAAGLERFLSEYPPTADAAFRATGGDYLSAAACDAMALHVRAPIEIRELQWQGRRLTDAWIYTLPRSQHQYLVIGDPADGGRCNAALVVMDRRSGEHCAVLADPKLVAGDLGLCAALLARAYNDAMIAIERNTGAADLRAVKVEAGYHRLWQAPDGKLGWHTDAVRRAQMWNDLRQGAEARDEDGRLAPEWTTPDSRLVDEARGLIVGPDGKPQHGSGSTDDIWTCAAIGMQLLLRAATKSDDAPAGKPSEAKRAVGNGPRACDLAY